MPVLHERIDRPRQIALALCAGGLAILTYPLMREGNMTGAVLAVLSAASLGAGTVYMKWSAVDADRLAHVFWQLIMGAALVAAALPIFEGAVHVWPAPPAAVLSLFYAGIVGFGFGFALWFGAIDRISVSTAALGILSVPLTGVTSSVIILGERPTATDLAGFVLIFAASACVLLAPSPAPRSQPTGG